MTLTDVYCRVNRARGMEVGQYVLYTSVQQYTAVCEVRRSPIDPGYDKYCWAMVKQ